MRKRHQRQVIVLRRKKAARVVRHEGAWKVAYADFVTAMMAFFMVMWILGMDQNVRNSIEGYFSNPAGYRKAYTIGKRPGAPGSPLGLVQDTPLRFASRAQEQLVLDAAGGRIKSQLDEAGLSAIRDRIEIVETNAGLRIELAEADKGADFFDVASSRMTSTLEHTLQIVARELAPLHNPVIIEGHTDAAALPGRYSNWELSADRANAARRVMEDAGLSPARVLEVRGLADRELRVPEHPLDPRNRRISILLPFMTRVDSSVAAAGTPGL